MTTRSRDRSAPFSSKDGFSVVAPTRTMSPASTNGRNASCCARLKRWISSTKRSVLRPRRRAREASSMTVLISLMPETTAENARNRAFVFAAMIRARVVLPLPGGPQKTIDGTRSAAIARARNESGPTRSAGPATSDSSRGRMRSASGASGETSAPGDGSSSSNRSPGDSVTTPSGPAPRGARRST